MEYNVVRKPLDTGAYINKSFTLLAIWNNLKKQKPPYIHALVKSLQEKYSSCFSFCFLTRLHSLDNNIQYNNTTTKTLSFNKISFSKLQKNSTFTKKSHTSSQVSFWHFKKGESELSNFQICSIKTWNVGNELGIRYLHSTFKIQR